MKPTSLQMSAVQLAGQLLTTAFVGKKVPTSFRNFLKKVPIAGVTLFRFANDQPAHGIFDLTHQLQEVAKENNLPPLLIAVDQEGGQLNTFRDLTLFPSSMAIGATQDGALAYRVGKAIGTELAAVGVNVNYAPVCDVLSNPRNPNIGIRAFGDQPAMVGSFANQFLRGTQSAGVAATVKHFPGNGSSTDDPHHTLPVFSDSLQTLHERDIAAFAEPLEQAKLCMTNHIALPDFTGNPNLPASVSRKVITHLLREELGYRGLVITDAMDMKAVREGLGKILDSISAIHAGTDLLLLTTNQRENQNIHQSLTHAIEREILSFADVQMHVKRILELKQWLSTFARPPLSVVKSTEHQLLALEVARRSVTLVQNHGDWFPLQSEDLSHWAMFYPEAKNQTPADHTAFDNFAIPSLFQRYLSELPIYQYSNEPSDFEISNILEVAQTAKGVILLTDCACLQLNQSNLVQALAQQNRKMVHVAIRSPYDLAVSPIPQVKICTYGQGEYAMQTLAEVLIGTRLAVGQLPVQLPDEVNV